MTDSHTDLLAQAAELDEWTLSGARWDAPIVLGGRPLGRECIEVVPKARAERAEAQLTEAREKLDNLLESLVRIDYEGQSGDVEDFDNARTEAADFLERLGGAV